VTGRQGTATLSRRLQRALQDPPNTGDQLQSPTQRRWRGGTERERRALLQDFRRALSAASPRSPASA